MGGSSGVFESIQAVAAVSPPTPPSETPREAERRTLADIESPKETFDYWHDSTHRTSGNSLDAPQKCSRCDGKTVF